jgi:superfamily I DNA/RNA helicase/mRNA-degrading endonuclease RelE of RelBE toxin-antitoxin system
MRLVIADSFTRSLEKLDPQSQNLVKQAAFDLQLNPANPGFKLHRLGRARDKRFWSARVSRDIRIIIHQQPDTNLLCYAGHHDDAYDWAENRKLEVHPDTGAPLFVEIEERIEEIVKRVVREESVKPPLFAQYENGYLQKLGVPTQWLEPIRYITEDNIDELDDHIPQEALERLYNLAAGVPVPVPTATAYDDPLEHPDAGRRFRILTDSEELATALEAPWEKWLVFLHPRQRFVVNANYNGPAKVVGGAGTGKTVVAVHRAVRLAKENPEHRILLTTFSSTLAERLSLQLELLLEQRNPLRQNIDVTHVHKKFSNSWRQQKGRLRIASESEIRSALENAHLTADGVEQELEFLRSEWRLVIDPYGIQTWEEYKAVSRQGRGTPLGIRQRLKVWSVFDQMLGDLKSNGLMTWSMLSKWAANEGEIKLYDHAVVDEAQDLGPAELSALRSIVRPGRNDLFFCGDAGQQIYRTPFSWSSCGLDIRGRSSRLRINYRTTSQIERFSESVLPSSTADEGNEEDRDVISLMSGPEPEVIECETVAEEKNLLIKLILDLVARGIEPGEIAIFARTDHYLSKVVRPALVDASMEYQNLTENESSQSGRITCGTMHRAKGLEFRVVILTGCTEGLLPLKAALDSASDAVEAAEILEREAHLLYVACSRARDRLILTSGGQLTQFLASN